MADDYLTIADMVRESMEVSDARVSNVSNAAPFVSMLPLIESSNGTIHKYGVETAAPVVGFRAANAGRDMDHAEMSSVTVNLAHLDFTSLVDKQVAEGSPKKSREEVIADVVMRHIEAALFAYETQIFQGTGFGGDAGGFSGLADNAAFNQAADTFVVNAGGTTAGTGSSAWLIKFGEGHFSGVVPSLEEKMFEPDQTVLQLVEATGGQAKFPAYVTPGGCWLGIQIASQFSAVRIANLTLDSGKGLTDDLIYQGFEKMEHGLPDVIVTSFREKRQLRESRTATNTTGAPAPLPTEVEGVPIIASKAIPITETLLA